MKRKHSASDSDEMFEVRSRDRTTKSRLSTLGLAIVLLAIVAVIAIAAVVVSTHPDILKSIFGNR